MVTNKELADLTAKILKSYGVNYYAEKRINGKWAICKIPPGGGLKGSDFILGLSKREVYFFFSGLVIGGSYKEKEKKAVEKIEPAAKSPSQVSKVAPIWEQSRQRGYDYLTEGALGDF